MKIEVDIIKYDKNKGIQFEWERAFGISTDIGNNEIVIKANSAGLISLAKQLLTLAQDEVSVGNHIHLDEYNSLEEGSVDLIIEKSNI
ncbi:MAG: hypothetical protein E7258_09660 [Lachnospiraceae bacterium]|nr:hypothetical protein [Lachnospiraceae bacterium]